MAEPELERIVDQVRAARAAGGRLCLRGGGTKDFYGGPPAGDRLDLRPLAGISRHEPTELVVTVRAGTPLVELEAALAEKGQCLAFEPPRFAAAQDRTDADGGTVGGAIGGADEFGGTGGGAVGGTVGGTVGGMVAAGLAGPARPAAGCVRDHVLGATLLNGRGELLSFGGQVMKNVAGYDLSRALAGSLGVFGVICEVSLKVLPRPAATATLRFEMAQADALTRLDDWGGEPLPIHASAWWQGMLVLRLAGAQAAVRSAARRLGGEVVDPALADEFWCGLRDQRDEYFDGARREVEQGATLWRLSLPPATPPLALDGEPLVEWGGAQRWLVSRAPTQAVRDSAARAGGHAVRYLGGDREAGTFAPLPAPLMRIHQDLKRAFDPDRVFNPHRLYPDL